MTKKELIEALEGYGEETEIFGVVETDEVHNSSHVYNEISFCRGTVQVDMLEENPALYLILSD